MANKYFYLRSVFEAEKTGELMGALRGERHPIIPNEYKIGCSASLSSTLRFQGCEVVSMLLDSIGLVYTPDHNPTQAAERAWELASNPRGRLTSIAPWEEGFITDGNDPIIARDVVAEQITATLRSRQFYFGQFDSGAGNNMQLIDFITGKAHTFA